MFDLKNLKRAIDQIAEEKSISSEKILEAVESAIAAAYRKEYGKKGEAIKTKLDLKTGDLNFWQLKTVVDANSVRLKEEGEEEKIIEKKDGEEILPLYNPDRHIFIEEAKKIKSGISVGDEMEFSLPEQNEFGRIASQAAKQVILQKIREIERDSIQKEYQGKEGEIVSGVVQRMERGNVYVDLGRATGIL
ncbi:MAG: NusA N-terminal domain-containing protein, partial [Patescibacteria group bacterium]